MNDKILILAAGNSSRLGQNKQILTIKGTSLLEKAINTCLEAQIGDIFLVLGYQAELHLDQYKGKNIKIVVNQNWDLGMGSSIATGIKALPTDTSGAYVVLPDQIKLDTNILETISSCKQENPDKIIASRYGDSFGAPSYFPSNYFEAMADCVGRNGAKKVMKDNMDQVKFVDFPGGEIDIDIPEDLKLVD